MDGTNYVSGVIKLNGYKSMVCKKEPIFFCNHPQILSKLYELENIAHLINYITRMKKEVMESFNLFESNMALSLVSNTRWSKWF